MISIIICSVQDTRFEAVARNYADLLQGEPHEIIRIADARSLSEGYNRGIDQSRGDMVVFSHDDIEILSPDLAPRLRDHLERFDLIGVAGTNRLIAPQWDGAGPPYIFGQVAQPRPQGGFMACYFGAPERAGNGIQAVDGLFFAMRRAVVEKIRFDPETFDGFHHYDLDFTFSAHRAGFRLGTCIDIHILHSSWGTQDAAWKRSARRFARKYAATLQILTPRPFGVSWAFAQTRQELAAAMRAASPI